MAVVADSLGEGWLVRRGPRSMGGNSEETHGKARLREVPGGLWKQVGDERSWG